jgi:hypothetical protein
VHEQWREENESNVVQESDREIEIVIPADRRVEKEDESRQAEGRKLERVRCLSSLFEQNKEPDKQEDQTEQVDVQDAGRPLVN